VFTYFIRFAILLVFFLGQAAGSCTYDSGSGDSIRAKIAPPEIDHVYLVLQQSSIDSIAHTPFVAREFAALKESSASANGESWNGTYLTGQRAYLEFFGPGGFSGSKEGEAGVGLNTSKLGQFQMAKSSLLDLAGDRVDDGLRTRVQGTDSVPWFSWLSLKESDSSVFSVWMMEFTEQYLHARGIVVDSDGDFSRHDLLTAKMEPNEEVPTDSVLFDDITAVDLELNMTEYTDLGILTRALGVRTRITCNIACFKIGNCLVTARLNEERFYCVRRLVCALTKSVRSPISVRFGPDALLEARDGQAVWYFGP